MQPLGSRTKPLITGWVVAMMLLFLAACGAPTGPHPGADQGLTQEAARDFSAFALGSLEYQAALYTDPTGILLTGLDVCTTATVSGDSDGDGIPDSSTYSYNCNAIDHGIDATGTIEILDTGSGVTVSVDGLVVSYPEGVSISFAGTGSVTESGGIYDSSVGFILSVTTVDLNASFTVNYTQNFTPTGATPDPFDEGALAFVGNAAFVVGAESYALQAQTDPTLIIDEATCNSFGTTIKSGAVVYEDDFGNMLRITYTDCNATLRYNGTPL